MPFTVEGFNHHGITVRSIDRARQFFEGVLGFTAGAPIELDEEFAAGVTGVPGARIRVVFLQGPGVAIELLEYLAPGARGTVHAEPSDTGAVHLALFVDDVRAVVDASREADWHLAGSVQPITVGPRAGGSAAYLRDSDGITVEIVQRPAQQNQTATVEE